MASPIEWIFDELPPSGARRGGEPAEHAFGHGLETFVREVVQNANDQALCEGDLRPQLRMSLRSLEGEALARVRRELDWPRLLEHLRAAGRTPTPAGRRLAEFLAEHEASERLVVCTIEDRNTVGLTGDEDGEHSHFRALCKDTLFSIKSSEAAGGSYGLGKSVLWAFSGLATVVFASQPSQLGKGQRAPRVIGRSELPFHAIDEQGYMGPGWLGVRFERGEGRVRAESIWGARAARKAAALALARDDEVSGTSVMVLGFRDPTRDADEPLEHVAAALRDHAATWFWPAMQSDHRGLSILVDGQPVKPEQHAHLVPFLDAWQRRGDPGTTLASVGDVVRVPIRVELPRARNEAHKHEGTIDLIVRLADEDAESAPRSLVMFRGPGMVVARRDYGRLAGLRPFHAILACGEGREPASPSESDRAIERFLRASEPPGHDRWEVTPAVRDGWMRGYASVLPHVWERVGEALRKLLAPPARIGAPGPDKLRKRFVLGRSGASTGAGAGPLTLRDVEARLEQQHWSFAGRIGSRRRNHAQLVTFELQSCGEDGGRAEPIAIHSLNLEPALPLELVEGRARVELPAGTQTLSFRGRSVELPPLAIGELALRVASEVAR